MDLKNLTKPEKTAVIVSECQEGVIGKQVPENLRQLADAVLSSSMLTFLPRLLDSARDVGIHVFHCIYEQRQDGLAGSYNTPLTAALRRAGARMVKGTPEANIVPELTPKSDDFIVSRLRGETAFHDTGLDSMLRNLGIENVILTGVSLNVAIPGTAIEAANRGYWVVLPTDCVAGFPPDYCKAVLQYSLRSIAYLTSSDDLMSTWSSEAM